FQIQAELAGGQDDAKVPHSTIFKGLVKTDQSTPMLDAAEFARIEITIRIEAEDGALAVGLWKHDLVGLSDGVCQIPTAQERLPLNGRMPKAVTVNGAIAAQHPIGVALMGEIAQGVSRGAKLLMRDHLPGGADDHVAGLPELLL